MKESRDRLPLVVAFAARHNRTANAARWRLCWLARWCILQGGGPFVIALASAIGRDTDTVYRMAQAAQAYLELYAWIRSTYRADAVTCQAALAGLRAMRRDLSYTHLAVQGARMLAGKTTALETYADLSTAAETGASVRAMAGHTSNVHSVVLPLWDAATVGAYLAQLNGTGAAVRFAVCEGEKWEGVERVIVRAEKIK